MRNRLTVCKNCNLNSLRNKSENLLLITCSAQLRPCPYGPQVYCKRAGERRQENCFRVYLQVRRVWSKGVVFIYIDSEVSPEGGEEIFESWPGWRCFDWLHHASDNVDIVTTCHICTTLHDHFDLRGSYSALRCSLHIGRYTLHSCSMASFCPQYWKVHWGLWGTH